VTELPREKKRENSTQGTKILEYDAPRGKNGQFLFYECIKYKIK
jgi:hypothetical protein